ncbi:hypothetical protein ACHQM5_008890 [Ranunculus cassubicifolius]
MDHHHPSPSPLLLLLLLSISTCINSTTPLTPSLHSPYLSPSLFFPTYYQMLQHLQIFIYTNQTSSLTSTPQSLFHTSLLNSPFTTTNGNKAHLFYLLFPTNSTYKAISKLIKDLQTEFPFWNRTLGADHFYVSCSGVPYVSDRNIVELKKNSIQVSCFPSIEEVGRFQFIPHKDITLPSLVNYVDDHVDTTSNSMKKYIGYLQRTISTTDIGFMHELRKDSNFLIQYKADDDDEKLLISKFCLFFYGDISMANIGKALRYGCVPVVITNRPIKLDLPFMDVLKWTEFTVFLEAREGVKGMKMVLKHICKRGDYEKMRSIAIKASKHFVWSSASPQPYDAFHTILYQLWVRRHAIRYARREYVNVEDALSALANNYI